MKIVFELGVIMLITFMVAACGRTIIKAQQASKSHTVCERAR